MAIANSGWKKPNPKPTCEAKATDTHKAVVALVNFVLTSSSSFPRNAQTTCLLPFKPPFISVLVFLLFTAKDEKRTDSDDDAKKTMILLCFMCIYVRLSKRSVRRFYEGMASFPPQKRSLRE